MGTPPACSGAGGERERGGQSGLSQLNVCQRRVGPGKRGTGRGCGTGRHRRNGSAGRGGLGTKGHPLWLVKGPARGRGQLVRAVTFVTSPSCHQGGLGSVGRLSQRFE